METHFFCLCTSFFFHSVFCIYMCLVSVLGLIFMRFITVKNKQPAYIRCLGRILFYTLDFVWSVTLSVNKIGNFCAVYANNTLVCTFFSNYLITCQIISSCCHSRCRCLHFFVSHTYSLLDVSHNFKSTTISIQIKPKWNLLLWLSVLSLRPICL